uniref:NADH-ubiquinone oxidoreductase chain 5 n=2 Tax=decula group TaxID=254008 RepID=A0A482DSS7_9HEMI|nr:NADH dehydrogenase subunit 5 [Magicicada septendecula]YP_009590130.1 NADH dehydrogenase subunit 5 [Magicicada tredecula]QBM09102.1 NADH dehydrogenase subunit 5 [Magicicada septendecula]QBM09115.1 NADH dehydrogenase subunit 5 [Magicicada septendecula]QBM09362.1 NADH dehydrogenase subunit 5 [Magicicada septendecula]QBM09375.1 NADH dehydrogenase subunit 5 [Magicicada septendecula]QBM09388.1 NADH dehydrogenase subunit 5 [Magicicada septendecula]
MTKNKLNMYIFLILLILSLMMLILSMNMIIFDYAIMMEWLIVTINSCNIYMTLIFDFMSTLFLSTVMFISSMVMLYSGMYMMNDKYINRFIYIIMMFVMSMVLLIISPNMVSILIGWDGLGLVSYCLVVYYQNLNSSNAGMLTALMNRIGDVMILLLIAWMMNFGSWNFMSFINKMMMSPMIMLIIIAGFTKSAQIPFSSWLPAAMAAPTPVSALVHSSTLVTAGVYLIIRFSNLIMSFNLIQVFLMLSLLTMIMSGLAANFEFDLKKIIALSTLSQLGIMMSILMFGYPMLSFFHLIIHALFKASLFLCAGVLIHSLMNNQDIRMMGCMSYNMPMTSTFMNIANLSLCGMPFMSGFYSKDLIMEMMCSSNINFLILLLMYIGIGMTSFYSARLTYFSMNMNFNYYSFSSQNESFNSMLKSIMILSIYSILSGSMFSWIMFNNPVSIILPMEGKLMAMALSFLGLLIGYEMSMFSSMVKKFTSEFMNSMWFLKQLSTFHTQFLFLKNSLMFQKSIDLGWGEKIGPQGMIELMKLIMMFNINMSKNNFKIQMMTFIAWFLIMM